MNAAEIVETLYELDAARDGFQPCFDRLDELGGYDGVARTAIVVNWFGSPAEPPYVHVVGGCVYVRRNEHLGYVDAGSALKCLLAPALPGLAETDTAMTEWEPIREFFRLSRTGQDDDTFADFAALVNLLTTADEEDVAAPSIAGFRGWGRNEVLAFARALTAVSEDETEAAVSYVTSLYNYRWQAGE